MNNPQTPPPLEKKYLPKRNKNKPGLRKTKNITVSKDQPGLVFDEENLKKLKQQVMNTPLPISKKEKVTPPPLPKEEFLDILPEPEQQVSQIEAADKKIQIEAFSNSVGSETHEKNEDSVFIDSQAGVAIICDGMGGMGQGDHASRQAIEILSKELSLLEVPADQQEAEKQIIEIFRKAHQNLEVGGTTASAVKVFIDQQGNKQAVICSLGDSRVFRLKKNNQLESLTKENTTWNDFLDLVDEMLENKNLYIAVRSGIVSSLQIDPKIIDWVMEQARKQPNPRKFLANKAAELHEKKRKDVLKDKKQRPFNDLYKGLNKGTIGLVAKTPFDKVKEKIEIKFIDVQDNDIIFATCDGVHDNLSDEKIAQIVKAAQAGSLDDLVKQAYDHSKSDWATAKKDDISVVGLKISEVK